jgi:CheY-like chemotaxis protein
MPEGGHIYLRSAMDGDEVVLEVQDTGKGMDEKVKARIFDPFFTTKGSQGLGLGMSVVYGIIERHNGKISVESQLGQGTCFTIRIPAAERRGDVRSEEVPVLGQRSARILVVDDEVEILELVAEILAEGGYTVVTAQSGPEGLQHLDSGEFDLLFCDLGMREMSGWDVVTLARERVPNLVVVLLTGWGATLSEEKVREHKIDAVLNKPFEMSKMLHTVTTLLERREQETSLAG